MVTKEDAEFHKEEYLGRDIFINSDSDLQISTQNDVVKILTTENLKQAVMSRLRTQRGELELHPDYGSRLNELIGTVPNDLTLSISKMHVREALLQEPRIETILNITPTFRDSTKQVIDIDIEVKPIKNLVDLNLVYSIFV